MTLWIKSTHTGSQPLVKVMVKPYLNPSDIECLLERLPRSPNFT
jgi:hypothetical protein